MKRAILEFEALSWLSLAWLLSVVAVVVFVW
jgi:hypothetical protein